MEKVRCPAWGRTCAACGERNHFKVSMRCKHQSVSTVTAHEDQVFNSINPGDQLILCEMEIKRLFRIQIDCGTTVCILSSTTWGDRRIRPERVHLQMWNKTSLPALGKCKVKVKNPPLRRSTKWTLSLLATTYHLSSAVLLHRRWISWLFIMTSLKQLTPSPLVATNNSKSFLTHLETRLVP